MKIQVKNLGTIQEGTVDLSNPLIIFAGRNNMGKSYMAYLIYGVYKMNHPKMDEAILKIFASKRIVPVVKISEFLPHSIYFFPAERTALNLLAKEVFRQKVATMDDFSQKLLAEEDLETVIKSLQKAHFIPRYPLAISDYLSFINDLGYLTRNESHFAELADEIEALLEGKIWVSDYGDIQFTPQNTEHLLELHISSSLVKSLSGLVLYFRHVAQQGDVIMIDEPELNLHPDSQRVLARVFAKAVNKGFKVILSTHSDYIIKEFNTLIMLNQASEKQRTELGYEREVVLAPGKVGAYLFSDNTVEAIEVSKTGLTIKTIDSTIDALDNTMESLYYRVFENV
jgi:predicted ATPase